MKKLTLYSLLLVLVVSNLSCVNTRPAINFFKQGDADLPIVHLPPKQFIEKSDLLSISVSSLSSQSSSTFNTPNFSGTTAVGYAGTPINSTGYLVNDEGYIKFPMLGAIKVLGLTEPELEEYITKTILERKLLLEPIVTVRHLNYKVTVLGEVGHPTVVNVPNEKISLLEAIGMAGDLTIYAQRDNVLLIREENGKKITRRLNLNSTDLFNSPYYYLKSNDVIYVEPNRAKVGSVSRSKDVLPIIFSVMSFGIVLIDLLTYN
jgi:polysaccharide export outer membrane protein